MSETDDTDVLVQIPPNFFSVHSSGSEDSLLDSSRTVVHKPSCTSQVLGKLVNQVNSIENRLESLELTSDSVSSYCGRSRHKTWDFSASVDSVSVTKFSTFPRRRRRKSAAQRDRRKELSLTSLDSLSSFSKIIPPLLLNNHKQSVYSAADDIYSMDDDLSSIVSSPSKKNDKLLLHEIDDFLNKVEAYELPDSKLKSAESTLNPENVIKATGDYISQKMDSINEIRLPSGRIVPSSVLDQYIYLVKNNPTSQSDKPSTGNNRSQTNDSIAKVSEQTPKKTQELHKHMPDTKSPSIRRLNFLENKDMQPTSTPKKTEVAYINSFHPSSNKIYERASKVLEQYKLNSSIPQNTSNDTSYLNSPKKDEFKVSSRPYQYVEKERLRPSLLQSRKFMDTIDTEMLSLTELWGDKKDNKVDSLRLEEERMKREHCEALIQELQKKMLEQQERLAVAIKVDRTKDMAISKLREAWVRLTNGLERTEEQHKAEIEKMRKELEEGKMAGDEIKKRAEHFEGELYKALDLAHDYQEKCKQLTNNNEQLKTTNTKLLLDKEEAILGKEKEIEVLRENYETVMRLNKQSADCVRNVEVALEKERQDHEQTKLKLAEFARQLQSSQEENDLIKARANDERARWSAGEKQLAEKQNLCCELMKKCEALGSETKHLQIQMELQKSSLKQHYQSQLEAAVASKLEDFQMQLENAERDLGAEWSARIASREEEWRAREEQHKFEIQVMEEKHKEETKLYRLQLAQASEKIGLLESKLWAHRARRGQLAAQLHGVMEAQWRQARALLLGAAPARPRSEAVSTPEAQEYSKIPSLSLPPLGSPRRGAGDCGGGGGGGGGLFNLDGLSDAELQQYVRVLLTKPPHLNGSGDSIPHSTIDKEATPEEGQIRPHEVPHSIPQGLEEPTSDRAGRGEGKERGKRGNTQKPPWKS